MTIDDNTKLFIIENSKADRKEYEEAFSAKWVEKWVEQVLYGIGAAAGLFLINVALGVIKAYLKLKI